MKTKKLSLTFKLEELISALNPDVKNICLLEGEEDNWQKIAAWNPCDSLIIRGGSSIDKKIYDFIDRHQKANHLLVGFLSYDLGYSLQGIKPSKKDDFDLPDVEIFAYDQYLEQRPNGLFAHYKNNGFINEISDIKILDGSASVYKGSVNFSDEWSKKEYGQVFDKIKQKIYDGVIYQINLTQRMRAKTEIKGFDLYERIAIGNRAKMKAYFEGTDFELISVSPERFIRTTGRQIETSPIKGTSPRGKDEKEDDANIKHLLEDEKEKAELNMITDLLRNDLGKVCETGSVKVSAERQIQKLSEVIHTFSTVKGTLKEDISPIEALLSMFPGGSITGCPKHKAMQLIDEFEPYNRGGYCGSIFTINENGDLDSNILIRTIIKKGADLSLGIGSGIVYDSLKDKEYEESIKKSLSITKLLD